MRHSIQRKMSFCAAHRLQFHQGACQNIHGHNFLVTVTVSGDLDKYGMVMELGDLAAILAQVHDMLDHSLLLEMSDPLYTLLEPTGIKVRGCRNAPTTEMMAQDIANYVANKIPSGVRVDCVHVQETDKNAAEVTA